MRFILIKQALKNYWSWDQQQDDGNFKVEVMKTNQETTISVHMSDVRALNSGNKGCGIKKYLGDKTHLTSSLI